MSRDRPGRPRSWPCGDFAKPFLFLSTLVNGNSCEIVDLDGEVDPEIVRAAVLAATRRHPLLQCRLERTLTGGRWVQDQAGVALDLRVERIVAADDEELLRRLSRNIWNEPLDLARARPLRVHVTLLPGRSIVQFVTHHVASDARAGYRLVFDVANAFGALQAGRHAETGVIDLDRSTLSRSARAASSRGRTLIVDALAVLARDLMGRERGLRARGKRTRSLARKLDLPAALLVEVKQAAKCRGLTVHAFLLTATIRAWQSIERDNDRRDMRLFPVLDMISLRSHAAADAADLYDTVVIPVSTTLDGRLDDEELLAAAGAWIADMKAKVGFAELERQRLYAFSAALLPKPLATRLVTDFVVKGNVVCSNPGPIPYPVETFGTHAVRDFWSFSQLFPPGIVTFTFSTFRETLRLVMVHDEVMLPVPDALDFAHRIVRDVTRLAARARGPAELGGDTEMADTSQRIPVGADGSSAC